MWCTQVPSGPLWPCKPRRHVLTCLSQCSSIPHSSPPCPAPNVALLVEWCTLIMLEQFLCGVSACTLVSLYPLLSWCVCVHARSSIARIVILLPLSRWLGSKRRKRSGVAVRSLSGDQLWQPLINYQIG